MKMIRTYKHKHKQTNKQVKQTDYDDAKEEE